jgi:hypothetical protein
MPVFLALKVIVGLAVLLMVAMMALGRIGAGIGGAGLAAAILVGFVGGSIERRKLKKALADVDKDYPDPTN